MTTFTFRIEDTTQVGGMTLEDALAIKLAFQSIYFQTPVIGEKEAATIYEAERMICARARQLTGLDFPELQWNRPGPVRETPPQPTFYSVVKTPTGYEYQRDPPGNLDHLGYPESKGKLP